MNQWILIMLGTVIILTSMRLIISKFGMNSTYVEIIKPGILHKFERDLLDF